MFSLIKRLFVLALVLSPLIGHAQLQRIQLTVDQEFQGREVVQLKRLILEQHPRTAIQQLQLVNVRVQAKSAAGRAQMALNVGGAVSMPQTVAGNIRDFNNWTPRSFHVHDFDAPASPNPQGVWQLDLQGNIKIARIIVSVVPHRVTPPRRLEVQDFGNFRYHKFLETVEIVRLNDRSVKSIELQALRNSVHIVEVKATLYNGDELFLDELTGFLSRDSKRKTDFHSFNGEEIRSLSIRATSPNPFGSRGELNVKVGSLR
jgi:hypothetical protein